MRDSETSRKNNYSVSVYLSLLIYFYQNSQIMKDNFSTQATAYAQFRPRYSEHVFKPIINLCSEKTIVWDCATGNGQAAMILANHFEHVFATDISQKQIDYAAQAENITYSIASAENTHFEKKSLDLIVVAQAAHWFNFEKFYANVNHFLKDDGVLALVGYGLSTISPEIDKIVNHFYTNIIGTFWDAERRHIEQHYASIPFPFKDMLVPEAKMTFNISMDAFIGYLNSWSAVQHFKNKNNYNPVGLIELDLKTVWGESLHQISFPVFYRVGKKM